MSIRSNIADLIKKADDAGTQLFQEVSGASDLDKVLRTRRVKQACYVIRINQTAVSESNFYQRITEQFAIITTCRVLSDNLGLDASDNAEKLCQVVFRAISGQSIDNCDPIEHVSGELIKLDSDNHIYQDIYQLEYTRAIKVELNEANE